MLHLPYGKGSLSLNETGMRVLASRIGELQNEASGAELVQAAMEKPIGSERLSMLAKGRRSCTIIISDHTRPVPSRDILPAMLRELRQGAPNIEVTLLVATGFHRPTTNEELVAKLGEDIAKNERIVVHDCEDAKSNVQLGVLPSGAPLLIDRAAVETELLIAEGFIEPHFFAGFSGGRKSVLPGICDRATVMGNHCSRFIDSPFARTGILEGNPLHEDMLAAAALAKLRFIVNVVIDAQKRTVAAFAGDPVQAHAAGCAFLRPYCEISAPPSDIVITTNGGAPLDQNLYQCVKGLTAAEAAAKEGAVLIIAAECADGAGGEGFYRALAECESPAALYASIMATPQEATIPDQWESQILARILMRHRVICVTRAELAPIVRAMKMEYAASLEEALKTARALCGDAASVAVIPDGVSVIIKPAQY